MECNCCGNRIFVEKKIGSEEISIIVKNPLRGIEIAVDLFPKNALEFINEMLKVMDESVRV